MSIIKTKENAKMRIGKFGDKYKGVKCKNAKGNELLIYINTKTLESEQIFTLLKTDGGTLVK